MHGRGTLIRASGFPPPRIRTYDHSYGPSSLRQAVDRKRDMITPVDADEGSCLLLGYG